LTGTRRLIAVAVALVALAATTPAAVAKTRLVGPAASSAKVQLIFPLVANDAGLKAFAYAVSTPGSKLYGHYESIRELAARFGASKAVTERVVRYLRSIGATAVKPDGTGMSVDATVSVAVAERAFGMPLGSFRTNTQRFIAPVGAGASVASSNAPAALDHLVTGVIGLDTQSIVSGQDQVATRHTRKRIPHTFAHASQAQPSSAYGPASGTRSGCAGGAGIGGFTPNQYTTAYQYSALHSAGYYGQGQRIALIETDGFKSSDIASFASCFGLKVPPLTVFGVGTKTELPPGGETTLDLEVLTAAAPGLSHIQVWENNGNAAQVDASFVDPLVQVGTKPQVISASLGLCEPYMYQGFHAAGINSLERDLELAASTGITVDASSGDSGSADCPSNSGPPVDALAVNYPASSPFVTGVGGTNFLLNANNTLNAEIVWNDTTVQLGAGGGGLSGLFPRPSYQDGVVTANQRAVPDISMLADSIPGYAIYCTAGPPDCGQKGPWTEVGGTSAAAPLFAGGAALVDQYLNHEGHEELGFVNPLLYAIGKTASVAKLVYNDVTAYGNDVGPYIPGGNGEPLGCCTAGPGFDEASGWGSIDLPNFALAAKAALPKFGDVSVQFVKPQHPVAAHQLKVGVHCTQPCVGIVEAGVEIGNKVIASLESKLVRIAHKGTKVVGVKFPGGVESKLRKALAHHKRITIRMLGAAVDSRGNIAKVTAVRSLTVKS
jgi:subtilase family serine protease